VNECAEAGDDSVTSVGHIRENRNRYPAVGIVGQHTRESIDAAGESLLYYSGTGYSIP